MEPLMASLHHPRRPPLLHGPPHSSPTQTPPLLARTFCRQATPTPRGVWPQHPPNASSTPANPENGIPHNIPNSSLNSLLNTPRISNGLYRQRLRRHNDGRNRRRKLDRK